MFVVKSRPKSIDAERYRILRASIQYSFADMASKVIIVGSSEQGEGKSTVAGNLAIAMAEDGKKTLLIDCDLRLPKVHRYFNINNNNGLSELIVGREELTNTIVDIYENLSVITAGNLPPNPSELLGSESMKNIINELREDFQYIILDSSPILAVSDSLVLSDISDGFLLVVRAGKTTKSNILEARKRIDSVNGRVIGSILNRAEVTEKNYQDYYN